LTDKFSVHLRGAIQRLPRRIIKRKVETLEVLIATIPIRVPFGAYTTIWTFLPHPEAVLKVLLCQRLQHLLRFGLNHSTVSYLRPINLIFIVGEKKKSRSAKSGE